MVDSLIEFDRKLFIILNGFHNPFLDQVMFVLTNTEAWVPLYIYLLYVLWKKYNTSIWIFLLGIALTIILSDRITTGLMKPYFLRLRPSHDPDLMNIVHTVNHYLGGKFGFASSHAANTFGTATFLFILLRRDYKYIWLIFIWALFVGYTRVYLGVHFPGDIIVGGIVGGLCGWLSCYLSIRIYKRKANGQGANWHS